jgi:hypothetical protein
LRGEVAFWEEGDDPVQTVEIHPGAAPLTLPPHFSLAAVRAGSCLPAPGGVGAKAEVD